MARYQRSRTQTLLTLAIVAALVVWRIYAGNFQPGGGGADSLPTIVGNSPPGGGPMGRPSRPGGLPAGEYRVLRVVDGDTLILAIPGEQARTRLQGLNTPETVKPESPVEAWGPEATEFTERFIRDAGNRVVIEVDGEPRDQYDRYLAFVWSGDRLLNEELVRAGLAQAKLGYEYSQAKKDRLRAAQREAQRARRGIWSEE